MKKYFKILVVVATLLMVLLGVNLRTKAYTIYPELPEHQRYSCEWDEIPAPVLDGLYNFIKVETHELFDKNDDSYAAFENYEIIYKLEKPINLPIYFFLGTSLDYYPHGGSMTFTEEYSYSEGETYETRVFAEYTKSKGVDLSMTTEFGDSKVTGGIELNYASTVGSELSHQTSINFGHSVSVSRTYNTLEKSYYRFERRAIFDVYLIQEIGSIYDVINKGDRIVRRGLDFSYAEKSPIIVLHYAGIEDEVGLFKYILNSENEFVLDTDYLPNSSSFIYY